jgi:hypothetical protein
LCGPAFFDAEGLEALAELAEAGVVDAEAVLEPLAVADELVTVDAQDTAGGRLVTPFEAHI